jgi:hypothetical protein
MSIRTADKGHEEWLGSSSERAQIVDILAAPSNEPFVFAASLESHGHAVLLDHDDTPPR